MQTPTARSGIPVGGGTGPAPCPSRATSRTQAGSQATPYVGRHCPPQIPASFPQGAPTDSTAGGSQGTGVQLRQPRKGPAGRGGQSVMPGVTSGRPTGQLRGPPRGSIPAPRAGTSELTDWLSAEGVGRTPARLRHSRRPQPGLCQRRAPVCARGPWGPHADTSEQTQRQQRRGPRPAAWGTWEGGRPGRTEIQGLLQATAPDRHPGPRRQPLQFFILQSQDSFPQESK